MPLKTSAYIAASLDGFIARPDGGLDWLEGDAAGEGEDYGYRAFIESVDVLVMGRNSFEKVVTFDVWPYDTPVVVLSRSGITVPESLVSQVEGLADSPAEVVARLEARGARHLYVDGGQLIQSFLRARLVDEIILTRIPVLLGQGIPLFGPLEQDLPLTHVETRTYPNGFVQSRYRPRYPSLPA